MRDVEASDPGEGYNSSFQLSRSCTVMPSLAERLSDVFAFVSARIMYSDHRDCFCRDFGSSMAVCLCPDFGEALLYLCTDIHRHQKRQMHHCGLRNSVLRRVGDE